MRVPALDYGFVQTGVSDGLGKFNVFLFYSFLHVHTYLKNLFFLFLPLLQLLDVLRCVSNDIFVQFSFGLPSFICQTIVIIRIYSDFHTSMSRILQLFLHKP